MARDVPWAIVVLGPLVFKAFASAGYYYRQARFGFWRGTVLWAFRLVDTDALQKRHWDLNAWSDEEVQRWKDSHLASCNAIAVAGAIFATLGLTALQIPDMQDAYWTARACAVISMVLGVFSVTTATRQHFTVVMLRSPLEVRLWMSRGKPKPRRKKSTDTSEPTAADKYKPVPGFSALPLESSIANLKATALPRHLLDLSVVFFMVSIGLYELSGWKSDAGQHGTAYRNVFIVFVVTLVLYVIYHMAIAVGGAFDARKRDKDFGKDTLGGFRFRPETDELTTLRRQLYKVQSDARESIDIEAMLVNEPPA